MVMKPFLPLGSLNLDSSNNFEVIFVSKHDILKANMIEKNFFFQIRKKFLFSNSPRQSELLHRILPVTVALTSHHVGPWQIVFLEAEQYFVAADVMRQSNGIW